MLDGSAYGVKPSLPRSMARQGGQADKRPSIPLTPPASHVEHPPEGVGDRTPLRRIDPCRARDQIVPDRDMAKGPTGWCSAPGAGEVKE